MTNIYYIIKLYYKEITLKPFNIFSRFTVEAVPGDTEIDASKQARNKQILEKHMGGYMAVSRPPVLSAIEEGNTIRSMKVLINHFKSFCLQFRRFISISHRFSQICKGNIFSISQSDT